MSETSCVCHLDARGTGRIVLTCNDPRDGKPRAA